jgi:DNA-binding NarL/FixJ family response regulator
MLNSAETGVKNMMIKVLLADDHKIVREGLRRIIEESGEMEVVAEAADGNEAISRALDTRPDVAVVDISMPGMDGLEVVSQLKTLAPSMPVLILTMHDEEQYVVRAVESGAMGYGLCDQAGCTGTAGGCNEEIVCRWPVSYGKSQ